MIIKLIDITGEKYGRLTVLGRAENKGRRTMWRCACDCGNIVIVCGENLKSGNTRSCGCIEKEIPNGTKHGMSRSRIAGVYNAMRSRCYNKNNYEYESYGGRGITVCDEWLNDRASFFDWAYKNGYDENAGYFECTLDRIDVNSGYSPDNCRWVSFVDQANNMRKNIRLSICGEEHTLSEWAKMYNINYHRLYREVVTRGNPIDVAISKLQ